MYTNKNCEVLGKHGHKIKVVSHGWIFIKPQDFDNDKIGWKYNVTLKTSVFDATEDLEIEKIEYVLSDKNNTRLQMIKTDFGENKAAVLESNSTRTYRESGFASSSDINKAFIGHCIIVLK